MCTESKCKRGQMCTESKCKRGAGSQINPSPILNKTHNAKKCERGQTPFTFSHFCIPEADG